MKNNTRKLIFDTICPNSCAISGHYALFCWSISCILKAISFTSILFLT
ncbi:unnamed protein product [Linum tenue]|uniref:Uncharacterized protein n=1 Tax=Linum tenue TaxID=586396 RepID=A0AAV0HAL1_9ROSI|nr:unnamed protein product [Linum tenue]